jgi:choline kinase
MAGDFVLLNGDTVFEPAVVQRLLAAPPRPVRLAVDHKETYDADDMKVSLDGDGRLRRVGKRLAPEIVGAESIGVMLFRGEGPALFREAIERALRRRDALHDWYLSVIDEMADHGHVWTASIQGLRWAEVDSPADIPRAQEVVKSAAGQPAGPTMARTS